ncbi:6-phosphogluconate dehydrogenase, NADP(+)-dependent, decarboxylating [Luteitalea pratensis]|uniref:6-phosphogluconate dehydrogenase, decarboxylating n=1 Tax=Luteitalea pratensis TaxID=1855912 RepID=A0A143PFK2_LUTPR|nr:NADP-dependent phosphogluconate dehydrogenase [Luteitalea pratensis]AMY07060.1 6-phosphogluconate dehydrogenase, NADP(+)-dependent, decarboxylating [Luteitalea pratensis]
MTCDIGVVGLGVMGGNLARNIESRGFTVAGYDLSAAKTEAFAAGEGRRVVGAVSAEALAEVLARPRKVLLMVPAGKPVDDVIAHVAPHLGAGDILIDAGNSYFKDTDRREAELATRGLQYLGTGVSGGEEGALRGPAIMPGGSRAAWDAVAAIFQAISAKADDGEPCVGYVGARGAGHYVKMVHNGIEYGDMQLIAETYDLFSRGLGMSASEISDIFAEWNRGELKSYLVEITADVLAQGDPDTGAPLVDVILDEAQQKGTGKWMSQNAFDVGAPIPTVNSAVESRLISAQKSERVAASRLLTGPSSTFSGGRTRLIEAAKHALYASKVTSYAQGMALLRMASAEYGYDIDPGEVARIWRAGCIIRATLLNDIRAAFGRDPQLVNLLLDRAFSDAVGARQQAWREMVQVAVGLGIPVPATAASLAYYDAYRSARLPANLTQGQRDYFGAHTYRRTDREGSFHTQWGQRLTPNA